MFFDASRRIALVLLDVEDGTSLHEIKTECGITVSPVAPAELIVYVSDSQCKVVFGAVYGSLPDGTLVVAAKNGSDAFPCPLSEPDLKVKLILDPYQAKCDDVDVVEPKLALWMDGCPICGKLTNEDVDEFEDDDAGDDRDDDGGGGGDDEPAKDWTPDGGGEEEPVEVEKPRRWTLDMLQPSNN
ncbi:MAG: hypothetical protein OK454_09730 [Thaumarchaeota archaeon]|nr:hypothetical protein [Nitrososphaerota archaeon]